MPMVLQVLPVLLWAACVADATKIPSVTLNNGVRLPMLSLGTGAGGPGADAEVRLALKVGFVAVDTARVYFNQPKVGKALAEVPRDSYFLTTKVGGEDIVSIAGNEYKAVTNAMEDDLKKLGLDYSDLMLLHYPPVVSIGDHCKSIQEQWRALEDFYKANKTRAIGVSNYCQADLECIWKTKTVAPAVNQIMFHVGMGADPRGLKSYCADKGIVIQAYSPLGRYNFNTFPPSKDHTLITGNFTNGIGKAYNKTGAQVALRWLIEQGVPLNTESSSAKHLQQDIDIFSFNFTAEDKAALDKATAPAGEPNSQFGGLPLAKACGAVAGAVVV